MNIYVLSYYLSIKKTYILMYNYFAHLKLKNSNNVSLGFYQQCHVQVDRICLPSCTNVKVSIRYKQKEAKSETFSIYMKNCTNSS